jgi:Clostripain family
MPERPPGSNSLVLAPVETIPNANSADPQTIVAFFKWAADECPAKQVILVMWGHGYGLDDYLPLGTKPHPPADSVTHNDAQEPRKEAELTDLTEQIASGRYKHATPMSLILDQDAGEVLPNAQLGAAVCKCGAELPPGQELAIIALDACTMAMIEVWCELWGCAQNGIASEAAEPFASFPYDRILARLILQPQADPRQVAKMFVDAYVESYAFQSDTFVTLSACDLSMKKDDPNPSAIGFLLNSVKYLAAVLTQAAVDQSAREVIFRARNDSPIFDPDGFVDLGRFCEILEFTLPDPEVEKACEEMRQALEKVVEYTRYSPLDPTLRISQSTGLSVWFPPWLEDPSVEIPEEGASIAYLINGYGETKFAQKTGWDKFLRFMWGTRG